MGNVREFPEEFEAKLVEAKEWADRHRALEVEGDRYALADSDLDAVRILLALVDQAEEEWGFAGRPGS